MSTTRISPHNRPIKSADAAGHTACDRLTWIIELMSRFATEKLDHHDSPRLAAVIVAHLNALAAETAPNSQLGETISHWLDTWEPILERQLALQGRTNAWPASLLPLVARARFGAP